MAVDEVVNWGTGTTDNPSPIPPGPDGKRPRRVGLSLQEMMASIARWRDTLSGVTATILLDGTDPRFSFNETDAGADNRYWDMLPTAEQWRMRVVNDAQNIFINWLTVDRTGTTVDLVDLRATTVRATGALDVTGAITVGGTVDGINIAVDVAANTAKDTNVPTALSIGTVTGTTFGITSDGGADDVVLPVFNVTEAGLTPLSGGGTVNFLRADGTWAAPPDSTPVDSVFGRTGAVTALAADYDSFFLTPAEGDAAYLGIAATAANSQLLDSIDSTGFLLVAGKAADSELLDGIDSANYARTDILEAFDAGIDITGDILMAEQAAATAPGAAHGRWWERSDAPSTGMHTSDTDVDHMVHTTTGTEQATTSGTTKDFTIPAGAKRITVMFVEVSVATASSGIIVQLGDGAPGIEATGYLSSAIRLILNDAAIATATAGFNISGQPLDTEAISGIMTICLEDVAGNTWVAGFNGINSTTPAVLSSAGRKSLSASLTTVRVTSISADTFDNGAVNVMWE